MTRYYVNKEAQNDGFHEVHKWDCDGIHGAEPGNKHDLGYHSSDEAALEEAKKVYSKVDGCFYCCRRIHKR